MENRIEVYSANPVVKKRGSTAANHVCVVRHLGHALSLLLRNYINSLEAFFFPLSPQLRLTTEIKKKEEREHKSTQYNIRDNVTKLSR
jgi:hypothetical protein